jgi:hypothetical protein
MQQTFPGSGTLAASVSNAATCQLVAQTEQTCDRVTAHHLHSRQPALDMQ